MSESVTVTIGGAEVPLTLPTSFAVRSEITLATEANWQRAIFAALGACWRGPGRPKARYEASNAPLIYGAAVLDELIGRGLRLADLWAPATQAYKMVAASILTEEEVAAAEGFFAGEQEE